MKKESGNYLFSLQYQPVAYMVLMDNEHLPVDREGFTREEREYGKFEYFTLRIKKNDDADKSDPLTYNFDSEEQYDSLLHYFETDMKKDFRLITGDDSCIASSIRYARENERGEFNNFLISFPAADHSNVNRTFVFNDRLLHTGMIRFTLQATTLSKVPELKL